MNYLAYVVEESAESGFHGSVQNRDLQALETGQVRIRVSYSSLNYKDALSASGNKGVTREYPHVPGIDAVGYVVQDSTGTYNENQRVIVTGYDLGMNTDGGFAQFITVPVEWVLPLPEGLDEKHAMILGTAGLTAGLSVRKLVEMGGVKPESGPVLVTGATGGVGVVACMLLSKLGFEVVAASGKPEQNEFLQSIGVSRVIPRDDIAANKRPLLKETWAGVIDTVGGEPLNTAVKMLKRDGAATTCGMVAGADFSGNVFPFILRGVNLLGIDSVEILLEDKKEIWRRFSAEWSLENIDKVSQEFGFEELPGYIDSILAGKAVGRGVLKLPE